MTTRTTSIASSFAVRTGVPAEEVPNKAESPSRRIKTILELPSRVDISADLHAVKRGGVGGMNDEV